MEIALRQTQLQNCSDITAQAQLTVLLRFLLHKPNDELKLGFLPFSLLKYSKYRWRTCQHI